MTPAVFPCRKGPSKGPDLGSGPEPGPGLEPELGAPDIEISEISGIYRTFLESSEGEGRLRPTLAVEMILCLGRWVQSRSRGASEGLAKDLEELERVGRPTGLGWTWVLDACLEYLRVSREGEAPITVKLGCLRDGFRVLSWLSLVEEISLGLGACVELLEEQEEQEDREGSRALAKELLNRSFRSGIKSGLTEKSLALYLLGILGPGRRGLPPREWRSWTFRSRLRCLPGDLGDLEGRPIVRRIDLRSEMRLSRGLARTGEPVEAKGMLPGGGLPEARRQELLSPPLRRGKGRDRSRLAGPAGFGARGETEKVFLRRGSEGPQSGPQSSLGPLPGLSGGLWTPD